MRRFLLPVLIAIIGLPLMNARLQADGLLHKLPADGAWAKFELEWLGPSPAGELALLSQGTMTISSVGRAEVNGELCRWIEIRNVSTREGKESARLLKLLIPEKYLLAGLNPLRHVVKAWAIHPAVNGGQPQEIVDMSGEQARPIRALTDMFYGPPVETQVLDEEVVDTPKWGSWKCPGIGAQHVLARGDFESVFTFETRLHDRAPFGVVTFRSSSIHKEKGEIKIPKHVTSLRLADFGTDATSALPDKK